VALENRIFCRWLQYLKCFTSLMLVKSQIKTLGWEGDKPRPGLHCPPTRRGVTVEFCPGRTFLLSASKTTHGAIYKGDTLELTLETQKPHCQKASGKAALPQALRSLSLAAKLKGKEASQH
jgi:hypothetical protein